VYGLLYGDGKLAELHLEEQPQRRRDGNEKRCEDAEKSGIRRPSGTQDKEGGPHAA